MKKTEMLELAKEIETKRIDIYNKKNLINDLDLSRKNIELTESLKVANELNADGKKVYSNEQSRKAETEKRLSQKEDYQKTMSDIKDYSLDIGREEIVIEFLRNKLKIELAFVGCEQ